MKTWNVMRAVLTTAALVVLAGCASPRMQKFEQEIETGEDKAVQMRAQQAQIPDGYFEEVDEHWFGDTATKVRAEVAEPEALRTLIIHNVQYPVTLQMVAEYVSTKFQIPVDVSNDALLASTENNYDPVQAMQQRSGAAAGTAASAIGNQPGSFLLQYEGTLKGFLDKVAARTGNSWRYKDGRIAIYNLETRTFTLNALPGATSIDATISNQSSGGGGAGGGGGGEGGGASTTGTSSQNTSMSAQLDMFEAAKESVTSMLSPKGKMSVSQSTGTITVTDSPGVLAQVDSYLTVLNQKLMRQVVLDVNVYSIELSDTDNYGIDWNLVWESINGRFGANGIGTGPVSTDSNSLSVTVLDETFNYGGTSVLLSALAQQGKLSIVTSASVATLSNQPVPVQVAEETSYLAQANTVLVPDVGAQTTLTPGSVTTGFSMNLLPVVLEDMEILLQMQISLSSLREIREIVSGTTRIETPQIDSRQFLQRVRIGSGDLLVLSGFEQERLRSDIKGMGEPKFTLAGGSRGTERRRTVIIVTLMPRVVA